MARRKKRTSVKPKESINSDNNSSDFSYNPVEPEIVEPKIKSFSPMYKDAGAGIVKFFKVVAIRDNNNKSSLKIKSGKLSDVINSDRKKFDSFEDACEAAKELTRAKEKRGYKTK